MVGIWSQWVDAYLLFRGVRVGEGTLRLRRHYLALLAHQHPHPAAVTEDDLVRFVTRPGWAPATRHSARATVQGFYRWAVRTGRMQRDPSAELPAVEIPVRMPRPVPEEIYDAVLATADDRLRLMLLLAGRMGLRRAEIAVVHTRDVVNGLLIVTGKGRKERYVPISPAVAAELALVPPGWVFPGQVDGHVSPDWVGRLLSRALGAGWSGHGLRKRFATRANQSGDWFALMRVLGHSRVTTTQAYVGSAPEDLRAVVMAAA